MSPDERSNLAEELLVLHYTKFDASLGHRVAPIVAFDAQHIPDCIPGVGKKSREVGLPAD